MANEILNNISHRRYNPLRDSWILVSPHRTKRPWQGQQEKPSANTLPDYEPSCYLCPGNKRAQGDSNPQYERTFAFVNDYSAVKQDQESYDAEETGDEVARELLRVEPVTGKCYVLTFSSAHNLTLADLSPDQISSVIQVWTSIYASHLSPASPLAQAAAPFLSNPTLDTIRETSMSRSQYRYMQIFENKGAAMGCSNPHPHGQIWTTSSLPEEPAAELASLRRYRQKHGKNRHLLQDYVQLELRKSERVIWAGSHWAAVCPWWAIWPFEVLLIPQRPVCSLVDATDAERTELAVALGEVTRRFDNLFETSFPYSMGFHQAPLDGSPDEIDDSYLHVHFYPPLLRSATVRKFLVGYEMLGEPQRDITPEQAAARLRGCGGELYRKKMAQKPS